MASLPHDDIQEGLPRKLFLFNLPVTQTAVSRNYYVDCRPVSQMSENGPVEFNLAGTSDYLDLKKSLLHVKARIVKADGSNLAGDDVVGPVNNFLHSLFSLVDISLNGKQFPSSGGATYAYKAYLQNLLNYGEEAKTSQIQCCLFFNDDAGYMDTANPNGANSGLFSRNVFCKESLPFDLEGPI